jgi:alkylation response protein AidB-like acyl-CoA dehydrogenase
MESSNDMQKMLARTVGQMLGRHQPTRPYGKGASHPDLWAQLVDVGLTAAEFPASHGGLEIAFADLGLAIQQFGRTLATTYLTELIIMGGWLVGQCEASAAKDIIPRLISGEAKIALASNEYGLGGEIGLTTTSAVQTNDGWILDGNKSVVVGGDRATHLIVPASIMPSDANQWGELALFLLPTNAASMTARTFELYDGSGAADFELRDARVAADTLLSRGAMAVDLFELALDRGRAALSHETVGLLERVSEITLDYVKTRKQFGQVIGTFQTMQHRMADMAMDIELAKSCAQLATDAIEAGTSASKRMQTISAASASICDCSRRVGQSAVQAHGAIALTQEYVIGHYFKRLTMLERYLGNADYHLERYVTLGET